MIVITGHMVRIGHAFVIRLMAGPAIRRQAVVLTARVAQHASQTNVRAGQREIGSTVVEASAVPIARGVAERAIVWESTSHMAFRIVVVVLMARPAIRGCALELAVDMALIAVCVNMCAGQRERRVVVIES